jgi:hypothetical protein
MIAALSALAFLPASAATSFEFLFSSGSVRNDSQYFGHLAVNDYGYSRRTIEPLLPRIRYVEADLPTILFLAHESGRSPRYIVDLRSRGMGWMDISRRCGVSVDVLFSGFDRDPGPPYGRAWGHWRNRAGFRLSDREFQDLVQVQLGSRWTGYRPYQVIQYRRQGRSVPVLVAERRGRPYGDHWSDRDRNDRDRRDRDDRYDRDRGDRRGRDRDRNDDDWDRRHRRDRDDDGYGDRDRDDDDRYRDDRR